MRTKYLQLGLALALTVGFASCQHDENVVTNDAVSQAALDQIAKAGFNTNNVQRIEEGYLVEGDIVVTEAELATGSKVNALRVGKAEQYRTTNLVKGLPRVITISVSGQLPSAYVTATDEAIRRYNAQSLQITFRRVNSGGDISLVKAPAGAGYLASAGFPTSNGDPYNRVKVNSTYLGSNPGTNYLATILAHEVGHCIGFRHTDYMDRSYSCGGSYSNEGASTVGAIHIPGTPTGPDPNSWMLACISSGQDRPFNSNDRSALGYLY
ncbi:M57 family metalloprotease [Pontibacter vulgaris]|uniref:M57 family metalloprotease n=1 Tax=Pontibacter vulgaris TaxID=2905679 RepID=UPI001FA746D5|nr:M57 family metalloprotease [Pontibacter vulgaris]